MAQTFYPITPVEVTPGTAGAWTDVDVSAYVPAGTTGIVLHISDTASASNTIGVRKNGSTDDRHSAKSGTVHFWAIIGVDANRIFEAYIGNATNQHIYLVAYTISGVTFFTNAYSKTLGTTSTWTDIDCHVEAPSAIGLIFEAVGTTTGYAFGMRKNASADNRTAIIKYHDIMSIIIGCDSSQISEGYVENAAIDNFYLDGYITDGATFNTNATDISLAGTGAWTDLTALPATSVMGFIEIASASYKNYGLRKNGSSEDIYLDIYMHNWAFVECDASYLIEGKIESTDVDFFVVGYATAAAGGVNITSSDSGVGVDTKATNNPWASLSKTETGSGVDASTSRLASLAKTDLGSGVDASTSRLASLTKTETGSGIDTKALLASLTKADLGSGVDFISSKIFRVIDAGVGTDALSSLFVALAKSDSGVGTETLVSLLVALAKTDVGTGTDVIHALLASILKSDVGAGVESLITLLASLVKTDSGVGVESIADRGIMLVDAGTGLDVLVPLIVRLTSTDTGVGIEYLATLLASLVLSDTGMGVDTLAALLAQLSKADSGIGTDFIIARALRMTDSGIGVDILAALLAQLSKVDSGSGIDALSSLLVALSLSDTGSGVDVKTLLASLTKNDSGVGVDALTALLAELSKVDLGSGIDLILSKAFGATEIGAGLDLISSRIFAATDSGIGADSKLHSVALSETDLGEGRETFVEVLATTPSGAIFPIIGGGHIIKVIGDA